MSLPKNSHHLFFIVLTTCLLLTPGQGYGSTTLDIFYSNDVSGQTEPCG